MPASVLQQINSNYGAQSIYLTGNPQITFFKLVAMRHTNFAMEYLKEEFISKPDFTTSSITKLSYDVKRNGDLMADTYLAIDLPDIYSSCIDNFKWIDNIGNYIIRKAEIFIGGTLIDRHYGQWMDIWTEISYTDTKKKSYSKLIDANGNDNTPIIYYGNLNFANGSNCIIPEAYGILEENSIENLHTPPTIRARRLYIPLQFWFCINPGLAIPLISLQYTEVRIDIEIEPLNKLFTIGPYNQSPEAFFRTENNSKNVKGNELQEIEYTDKYCKFKYITKPLITTTTYTDYKNNNTCETYTQCPTDEEIKEGTNEYICWCEGNIFWKYVNGTTTFGGWNQNTFLEVNYIFLDSDERTKFAYSTNEYIIPQIQRYETTGLREQEILELKFQHPVEELIWVFQRDDIGDHNDWSNYTNFKYYKDYETYLKRLQHSQDLFYSDGTKPLVDVLDEKTDILDNIPTYCDYLHSEIMPSILPSGIHVDEFLNEINNCDNNKSSKHYIEAFDELYNIMYEMKFKFNGMDRTENNSSIFYESLQSFKYNTNFKLGVYKYSFALDPEKLESTGHANLSRINKFEMEFLLRDPPKKDVDELEVQIMPPECAECIDVDEFCYNVKNPYKYRYNMFVYAKGYNILRIMNGIGSVVFAN